MRPRLVPLLLLLAALACAVPPALTPTPTHLPVTPARPRLSETPAAPGTALQPTAYTPWATLPTAYTAHRIAMRSVYGLGEFFDQLNGEKFTPRGVTYLPSSDPAAMQDDFRRLRAAGYNTLRMLIDDCTPAWGCLATQDGQGLDPAALDSLTALLRLALDADLVLILASTGLPPGSSYAEMARQGQSQHFAGERNLLLLTPHGLQAAQAYWSDLLSGLASRQAPLQVVLGWQLLAEAWYQADQPPFSLETGEVTPAGGLTYDLSDPAQVQDLAADGLRHYSTALRQLILSYDPGALVGLGLLVPAYPNPARPGDLRYSATAALLATPPLDFFDLRLDPASDLSLEEYAENFGLGARLSAPLLMGQLTADAWTYPSVESAAAAVQDWIAASCIYGFDGWLYAPFAAADDAWSFNADNSFLMQAISPRSQPDPCTVTVLPGRNLALGRPVTVSAALPEEPPEAAVDGDTEAQWSAGAFPEQWLMIDLGAPYTIGSIRLLVGQWPAGQTRHQLFVAGPDGAMRLLVEFDDYTRDYDWLEYLPDAPLRDVQYIRLLTLESPAWVAWREIEVLAPSRPTPTPTELPVTATP